MKKSKAKSERLLTNVLYNQALLAEGLPVADSVDFAQVISALLVQGGSFH